MGTILFGPLREKPFLGVCKQEGADQSTHPCSMISALIIRLLESIISNLATSDISLFQLVSVTKYELAGNSEDRFSHGQADVIITTGYYVIITTRLWA